MNEKYWIYRDKFRKRFVNVGKLDGQSLPFIQIFEGYNTTVLDSAKLSLPIPDSQKEKGYSGSMSKGEMGIELGNYIAVLATEYRLLKWDGAGIEEMTTIRNELFL